MRYAHLLIAIIVGCDNPAFDTHTPEPPLETGSTGATADTGEEPPVLLDDYVGQVMLTGIDLRDSETRAIFPSDDRGIVNLAECHSGRVPCYDSLPPAYGEYVEPVPFRGGGKLDYADLGREFRLGLYGGRRRYDDDVVSYGQDRRLAVPSSTSFDLQLLPGDFGPYNGDEDLRMPSFFELDEPRRNFRLAPGMVIPFRWQPLGALGGEGDLYLEVRSADLDFYRLYLLEDTGSFDLDTRDWPDIAKRDDVEFYIGRWQVREGRVKGRQVTFTGRILDHRVGNGIDTAGRLPIRPADSCTSLKAPVPAGSYYGFMTGSPGLDPGPAGCTGVASPGADLVFPVVVPGGQELVVELDINRTHGAVYVLSAACDTDSCLEGDESNGTAHVSVGNPTLADAEYYVVIDTDDGVGTDFFTLDLSLDPLAAIEQLPEDCSTAASGDPLEPGVYNVSTGVSDDESGGACGLGGTDKVFAVSVGPGQELQVDAEHGEVFLLSSCGADCLPASSWLNTGTEDLTLLAVLEDQLPTPVTQQLSVSTTPRDLLPAADECTEALVLDALAAGTYTTQLAQFSSHLSTGGVCAGTSGGDVSVPIHLGPYERVTATAPADVRVVFTAGCATGLCHGVGSGLSSVHNDSADSLDLFLTLDSERTDVFDVSVVIDYVFSADWSDTCAEAETAEPITRSGTYVGGNLSPGGSELNPPGCAYKRPDEREQKVPLIVPPNTLLDVALLHDDPSDFEIYLLDDCDTGGTCLSGSSARKTKELAWLNTATEPAQVFLVVDSSRAPHNTTFEVSVDFTEANPLLLADNCVLAEALDPVSSGTYLVDVSGFSNAGPQCDNFSTARHDGMVPVTVEPGDLLTVRNLDGIEVAVIDSCDTSNDSGGTGYWTWYYGGGADDACLLFDDQRLTWFNSGAYPEDLFLMFFSTSSNPRLDEVTIEVGPVGSPLSAVDSCTELGSVEPMAVGIATTSLTNRTDAFSHSSCALYGGKEVFSRYVVPAGHRFVARSPYTHRVSVLEDCGTCGAPGRVEHSINEVYWDNPTAGELEIILVVEAESQYDDAVVDVHTELLALQTATAAEECGAVGGVPGVGPGAWHGNRVGVDDLDASSHCASRSSGAEAILPVSIPAQSAWAVSVHGAQSVYLLEDCTQLSSCVSGDSDRAGHPALWLTNPASSALEGVLVVDDDGSSSTDFDLLVREYSPASAADSCSQAAQQVPLGSGRHRLWGTTQGHTNALDPVSCVFGSNNGGEALVSVEVPAGGQLLADVMSYGFDANIYLVADCSQPADTCVHGNDEPERVSWVNNSGASQRLTLVIDSSSSQSGEFSLDLSIE